MSPRGYLAWEVTEDKDPCVLFVERQRLSLVAKGRRVPRLRILCEVCCQNDSSFIVLVSAVLLLKRVCFFTKQEAMRELNIGIRTLCIQ